MRLQKTSIQAVPDHFAHVGEMIKMALGKGKRTIRKIDNFDQTNEFCNTTQNRENTLIYT
jgi:hypothetical protein